MSSENSQQESPARRLVAVPEGGLWTVAHVAQFLSVSERWVWKQVRLNGGFPFVRIGARNVRFDPSAVRAWVSRQAHGVK